MRIFLLQIIALAMTWPALSMDYKLTKHDGRSILAAEGKIERSEVQQLMLAIQKSGRVDELRIDSPGGNSMGGLELGRFIHQNQIGTRVASDSTCASACVFVFAGGFIRQVEPGARIGVHMFSLSNSDELIQLMTRNIDQYGQLGARKIMQITEQGSASFASEITTFLLEMSVSVALLTKMFDAGYDEMDWLSFDDLYAFNLINTDR